MRQKCERHEASIASSDASLCPRQHPCTIQVPCSISLSPVWRGKLLGRLVVEASSPPQSAPAPALQLQSRSNALQLGCGLSQDRAFVIISQFGACPGPWHSRNLLLRCAGAPIAAANCRSPPVSLMSAFQRYRRSVPAGLFCPPFISQRYRVCKSLPRARPASRCNG